MQQSRGIRKSPEQQQRNNQLAPPEKEKCHPTTPTSSEGLVDSVAVSEIEAEPPRQTIVVPISSEISDTARSGATTAPEEQDKADEHMGTSKRSRSTSPKTETREQEHDRIAKREENEKKNRKIDDFNRKREE